jgi:ABC-type xylose transport system permease subunit
MVTAATTGSASRLAGIETRLIRPEIAAMTGAVTTLAAAATAARLWHWAAIKGNWRTSANRRFMSRGSNQP